MTAPPGRLYVVATPIGNLGDLSPRAVEVLRAVDLVACEDTRHTRKLLAHFQIRVPTLSCHEHNEVDRIPRLLAELQAGHSVALVADAGTPLLSDPGYRLVRAARDAGLPVIPIPGPFAAAAAVSVAGLPTDRVLFAGFPPDRAAARQRWFQELACEQATLVIYLSPHRLLQTLQDALSRLGPRRVLLAREMTKIHEEHWVGRLDELVRSLAGVDPRGEYTLVIEGAEGPAGRIPSRLDVEAYIRGLMELHGLTRSQAARRAASDLQLPRRKLYQGETTAGE
ncbi:MAG: 16S rRNA (cytidine(1402)-2'-O)-methyltransferase [Acidobacteriota bacterium]